MASKTEFVCAGCTNKIESQSPDPQHVIFREARCDTHDDIKIDYKCPKCGTINTRFWDVEHNEYFGTSYNSE